MDLNIKELIFLKDLVKANTLKKIKDPSLKSTELQFFMNVESKLHKDIKLI